MNEYAMVTAQNAMTLVGVIAVALCVAIPLYKVAMLDARQKHLREMLEQANEEDRRAMVADELLRLRK